MNKYDAQVNFVTADAPTVAPVAPNLLRRQDVVEANHALIQAYNSQQSFLLGKLQDEVTGHGGSVFSDADVVLERRRTSRMYLASYALTSAMTMAGISYLAHVAAGVESVLSLAGWLAGTGGLTAILVWLRHGDEFRHSAEGIARHLIDAHADAQLYGLETQRLIVELEHDAEERRQQAAVAAAADARQTAALRIQEIESRRKAAAEQSERRYAISWHAESPQTPQAYQSIECAADAPTSAATGDGVPSSSPTCAPTWQDALMVWIAALYNDPKQMTAEGIILARTPWASRSDWQAADKAAAKRICCDLRPPLIVPADGKRFRLRTEMFTDADLAMALLQQRLDD